MAKTDIISKALIKEVVKDLANYLLDLDITQLTELGTEKHRIEVRHADIVMLAQDGQRQEFILHLELQHNNHKDMALRMLRYYTDIALSYPKQTIKQYVIYTGSAALRMESSIKDKGIDYHYTLLDMSTLDCERFIAENSPDALVLAILCDFKGKDGQQVIEEIITRLISLTASQPEELSKYLKMLEILSASRKVTDAFKRVEQKMLSEINIEKLPSYQIGIDRGIEQGLEQGIEQEKLKIAQSAKKQGVDLNTIMKMTGLSRSQIEGLK